MGRKKRKRNQSPVLVNLQRERRKARSLGYENTEEYEKGLSTIKRLLANKDKPDDQENRVELPENPPCPTQTP